MQNQPNPRTPVHERRWLDRLRAAWDEVRASPRNKAKARALDSVAEERPEEARYRINTFGADAARRTRSAPARPEKESLERGRDDSDAEIRRGRATSDSDRFDDEAGR